MPTASAVLRIASRIIAMVALLIGCVILFYLWKWPSKQNPWPRRFLAGISSIAGVRVRTTGRLSPGRTLLLANHVSWLDIPALAATTGTAFVAHDGLAGVPLLRWLCAKHDTVFVARHDRASIGAQIVNLREALAAKSITVFAEGTTSNGSDVLPFKSALLAALDPLLEDVVVQPVWIDYGAQTSAIAWVDQEPGLTNFKRILARVEPVRLTIHFLDPLIAPALADRKTIAVSARQAIVQAMVRVPTPLL